MSYKLITQKCQDVWAVSTAHTCFSPAAKGERLERLTPRTKLAGGGEMQEDPRQMGQGTGKTNHDPFLFICISSNTNPGKKS